MNRINVKPFIEAFIWSKGVRHSCLGTKTQRRPSSIECLLHDVDITFLFSRFCLVYSCNFCLKHINGSRQIFCPCHRIVSGFFHAIQADKVSALQSYLINSEHREIFSTNRAFWHFITISFLIPITFHICSYIAKCIVMQ